MADPATTPGGCPLQLVCLDMDAGKVIINEDALGRLEKNLRLKGAKKVAVISVMGAFRTGKSFLLDLFLRFLRYEEQCASAGMDPVGPATVPRGSGEDFPLPAWLTSAGNKIEGASEDHIDGFRFRGGMDACTEGIWVWSEPFLRKIDGQSVALLLMDTQGAWDSNMTKEQSATIFGLTAVLSSKQIYNIDMQIQEDKVENLAYFMRFAQAALRQTADELARSGQAMDEDTVARPFQSLDFLVRNWRHFRENWTTEECEQQMVEHLGRHLDPKKVRENSTAEALQSMFKRINCFCLPHPGLAIERETWTGDVADISNDFVRFVDTYTRQVFQSGLKVKSILGSDLSTITFPLVLKDFVNAFHDAAPVAMTFTQAMTNCTVLLAKEKAMKSYQQMMDQEVDKAPRGIEPDKFDELNRSVTTKIKDEYERITIFGGQDTRSDTWQAIEENLSVLHKRYLEDNSRRLEKALVAFANIALLGITLFALDRISDWVCDWWSQTCCDMSKVMLLAYIGIFGYIGVHAYFLFSDRGRLAAAVAGGELWKEIIRLVGVYGDLLQHTHLSQIPSIIQKVFAGHLSSAVEEVHMQDGTAKKDK